MLTLLDESTCVAVLVATRARGDINQRMHKQEASATGQWQDPHQEDLRRLPGVANVDVLPFSAFSEGFGAVGDEEAAVLLWHEVQE
jgi:hypothetical protein